MRILSLLACAALILCSSCTKIIDQPAATQSFSGKTSQNASIENLGTAITGTNIFWKLHPLAENMEPLFTHLPFSNSGFSVLMIDNGNKGTTPFRFIAVDLQNKTSKTIHVTDNNGSVITKPLGRITRTAFGMNKKFYVATENGGHLIEYDPFTQTAKDLGQPFIINGKLFDIYSLRVGKDGALYGGSFGGNGDVYTFRYDYTSFYVDKVSIDENSRYVTYVTGDEKYTYASCGQNSWKMYAIERATGKKTLLLKGDGPSDRIYSTTNTDACYAQFNGTNYKLNGTTATAVSPYDKTSGPAVSYLPYAYTDSRLPKVIWSEFDRKLYFKFSGQQEEYVKITDVIEEVYPTTLTTSIDNKLFITGGSNPRCVTYDPTSGFTSMGGTNIGVFTMAVVPGSGGKKVVMGGYPKGALLEYNMNTSWNLGITTLTTTAPDIFSQASNPRKIVQLQDADHGGVFGPMTINGIFYTKDGSLVAAGNNDRVTESAGRELGIGTFKNGVKRNFTNAQMKEYEFQSMCLSPDSTEVLISAVSKHGTEGKIFKYNPSTNSITSVINFPVKNPGIIKHYKGNLIAGAYEDVVYLMDLNTKAIIWKTTLGNGQRITAFTIAPDGNAWIVFNYLNSFTTKMVKYELNTQNLAAVTSIATEVTVIKSPDAENDTKPTGLTFMRSSNGTYDLYISGFKALCRIRNAIPISS